MKKRRKIKLLIVWLIIIGMVVPVMIGLFSAHACAYLI